MRYIDCTNKKATERGNDKEISSLGALSEKATKIAESNRLGVLKTSWGPYRIIKASGLGAYEDILGSLEEVNAFLLNLKAHENTKY